MCIAMDYPLNLTPNEFETMLSAQLLYPGFSVNHLLCIPTSAIGQSIFIEPIFSFSLQNCPGNAILLCSGCNRGNSRSNMLYTCDKGHVLCASHIIPWSSTDHRPDFNLAEYHIDNFISKAIASCRYNKFVKTRALMCYFDVQSAISSAEKEEIIQATLGYNRWACDKCFELYQEENIVMTVEACILCYLLFEITHFRLKAVIVSCIHGNLFVCKGSLFFLADQRFQIIFLLLLCQIF